MSRAVISISVILLFIGGITTLLSTYYLYRNVGVLGSRATPIDRVRSGKVAVRGIVKKSKGIQLRTPVGSYPCVWFRTVLYRNPGKGSKKDIIFQRERGGNISLTDDTGTIFIKGVNAKKFLNNKVQRTIGVVHGWPDGFRQFLRNNDIAIDMNQISNNSYYLVQEYIAPMQEIKVTGLAQGPGPVSREAVRPTVPYEIVRGEWFKDSFTITNIHMGKKLIIDRAKYILSLMIGLSLFLLGIWFLIVGLDHYLSIFY